MRDKKSIKSAFFICEIRSTFLSVCPKMTYLFQKHNSTSDGIQKHEDTNFAYIKEQIQKSKHLDFHTNKD